MNQFTAKKIGEVLAFAQVGAETLNKGEAALRPAMSELLNEVMGEFQKQDEVLKAIADTAGAWDIVDKKVEGTGGKLRQMRDLYIGDEWDNVVELAEWFSFFEGAAIAHWELVRGAAQTLNHEELLAVGTQALVVHNKFFDWVRKTLAENGATRARD